MKCPSCETFVTKIPVNWKCPHCGEPLPDPSRWYLFYTGLMEYLEGKGTIFWSVAFGIFLIFVGAIELLCGSAGLLGYLSGNIMMSFVGIFFTGMLIDMVVMINLPLRLGQGTDFIINERKVIRNIRKATNLAALIGFIYALVWLGPGTFLEYFPTFPITISWFLAMAWAIIGLFLDVRMVEDVRFRAYMDRLGITSLKRYRRVGTAFIGLLVVVAATYHILLATHGLWIKFSNLGVVGGIIRFAQQYLSWLV